MRLPTSNIVVDRSTIAQHLLNDETGQLFLFSLIIFTMSGISTITTIIIKISYYAYFLLLRLFLSVQNILVITTLFTNNFTFHRLNHFSAFLQLLLFPPFSFPLIILISHLFLSFPLIPISHLFLSFPLILISHLFLPFFLPSFLPSFLP